MPYIELKTSVALNEEKKTELKAAFGEIVTLIPGKTEAVTMIGLIDGFDLYLGGIKLERGAYVEVKMYKEASFEGKAALTDAIFKLLKDSLEIENAHVYVTFFEQPQWGAKGSLK